MDKILRRKFNIWKAEMGVPLAGATHGGTGSADLDSKYVGVPLQQNGDTWIIMTTADAFPDYGGDKPNRLVMVSQTRPNTQIPYEGGTFTTMGGKSVVLGLNGSQLGEETSGSSSGSGSTHSTSSSISGSYYIPNALDFLDGLLKTLDAQMANNQIPQANAIAQFNAAVAEIAQEIEINISNANRDLDAQKAQANAEIDIFQTQRQTRQRVAEDYTKNILPFQMPEGFGLNLPLIGDVPTINVDLNTIYDIPGIMDAPDIDIVAEDVDAIDPDRYPDIPDTPQVDFDFQAEIDRLNALAP